MCGVRVNGSLDVVPSSPSVVVQERGEVNFWWLRAAPRFWPDMGRGFSTTAGVLRQSKGSLVWLRMTNRLRAHRRFADSLCKKQLC